MFHEIALGWGEPQIPSDALVGLFPQRCTISKREISVKEPFRVSIKQGNLL